MSFISNTSYNLNHITTLELHKGLWAHSVGIVVDVVVVHIPVVVDIERIVAIPRVARFNSRLPNLY